MLDTLTRLNAMPTGQPFHCYVCLHCSDMAMTRNAFLSHMAQAHHIPPEEVRGSSHAILHQDTADFAVTVYAWNIRGIPVEQYLQVKRVERWDEELEALPL